VATYLASRHKVATIFAAGGPARHAKTVTVAMRRKNGVMRRRLASDRLRKPSQKVRQSRDLTLIIIGGYNPALFAPKTSLIG
jgi:hypothetical protein